MFLSIYIQSAPPSIPIDPKNTKFSRRSRKRYPVRGERFSRFNRRQNDYYDDDNYGDYDRRPSRGRNSHSRSEDLW